MRGAVKFGRSSPVERDVASINKRMQSSDVELGKPLIHAQSSGRNSFTLPPINVGHNTVVSIVPQPAAAPLSAGTPSGTATGTASRPALPPSGSAVSGFASSSIPGHGEGKTQMEPPTNWCVRAMAYLAKTFVEWFDTYDDALYVNP